MNHVSQFHTVNVPLCLPSSLFPVSVCTALHFGTLVMRRRDGLPLLALGIALAFLPPLMLFHFHGSAPCVEGFLTLTPVQLVEVTVV